MSDLLSLALCQHENLEFKTFEILLPNLQDLQVLTWLLITEPIVLWYSIFLTRCSVVLQDISDLETVKSFMPGVPVFFVRVPARCTLELTESAQDEVKTKELTEARTHLFEQLCNLGYLSREPLSTELVDSNKFSLQSTSAIIESVVPKSRLIEDFSLFPCFLLFVRQVLQYHVITAACHLNDAHLKCLAMFIEAAFDMARDITITPKRLAYARAKEEELFRSLMDIANRKQEEIKEVIHDTIETLTPRLQEEASLLKFDGVKLNEESELLENEDLEKCTLQVQELVLGKLNQTVASKLISSVEYLKESYVGTLTRCLQNLEKADADFAKDNGSIASGALKLVRFLQCLLLQLKNQG